MVLRKGQVTKPKSSNKSIAWHSSHKKCPWIKCNASTPWRKMPSLSPSVRPVFPSSWVPCSETPALTWPQPELPALFLSS